MKTNTIEVEVPEGFELNFDKLKNKLKITEKPKNVMERIRTIADVIIDNKMSVDDFEDSCVELEADERAYRIIKLLAKSLNEGWTPNWDNSSEGKYVPWFYMDGGSSGFRYNDCAYWGSASVVGSRLCFKSRELAEYAGKQFIEVYKLFMTI